MFRLKRQQFIELLRQQTTEADGAALGEQQAHPCVLVEAAAVDNVVSELLTHARAALQ